MQNSSELVYIGLTIAFICFFGIVSVLVGVSKGVKKEAENERKGKKNEN